MSAPISLSLAVVHKRLQKLTVPLESVRVKRLCRRAAQGTSPAQMLIHLPSHSRERLNILSEGAVDYSCCFTKFPFGSTSNRDSLPLALTNTS